jgi:hypothetical protein
MAMQNEEQAKRITEIKAIAETLRAIETLEYHNMSYLAYNGGMLVAHKMGLLRDMLHLLDRL